MKFVREDYVVDGENLRRLIAREISDFGDCQIILELYHVGNHSDFLHFPDGSWLELQMSFDPSNCDGPFHTIIINNVNDKIEGFEKLGNFAEICMDECRKFNDIL